MDFDQYLPHFFITGNIMDQYYHKMVKLYNKLGQMNILENKMGKVLKQTKLAHLYMQIT